MATEKNAPVIIIGAGGTGCTLALLLASYGIPSILVERRLSSLQHPAAHVLNGRSFEIWSQYSPALADEIMNHCPSEDEIGDILWCTSLLGKKLGRINLLADTKRVEQVKSFSPYRIAHVGQHLLMPILWRTVEAEPLITFIKETSLDSCLDSFHDDGTGVTVTIAGADGKKTSLKSSWLIGADGANSAVRDKLGITMEGPVLANMASIFFNMKLDEVHPEPRPLLSWIYNPDFCGVMIKHADDNYILMSAFISPEQVIANGGGAYWEKIIPKAIGTDDVPFHIHTTGTWSMTAQLATAYGLGRTLLVGDAAHRFPHTGGFGLNSGVQDAHNVAWKLAAVLEGRATASLMQTYEAERKPVISRFASQSVSNHFKLDEVTRHIGIRNRDLMQMTRIFASAPASWLPKAIHGAAAELLMRQALRPTHFLNSDSFVGRWFRNRLGKEIPGQLEHFISTGLEYGFAYNAGLVQAEPTPQPLIEEGITDYRPTTWPGSRLPHVVVQHNGQPTPIHDLIDRRKFTLVCANPKAWRKALSTITAEITLGISIVELSAVDSKNRQMAIDLYEVGEQGAVLVRPDQHVAWRTKDSADMAAQTLVDVANCIFSPYCNPSLGNTRLTQARG